MPRKKSGDKTPVAQEHVDYQNSKSKLFDKRPRKCLMELEAEIETHLRDGQPIDHARMTEIFRLIAIHGMKWGDMRTMLRALENVAVHTGYIDRVGDAGQKSQQNVIVQFVVDQPIPVPASGIKGRRITELASGGLMVTSSKEVASNGNGHNHSN